MKVLAIGAHPDDIEIFMLGFLLACQNRKDQIFLAVATDGAKGKVLKYPDLIKTRKEESINALKFLAEPFFFNFPDGDLLSTIGAQSKIKDYIATIEPDLILTHSPEDYHTDHTALSHFVKEAVGFRCPILYSDTLMGVNFYPDYYIDITPYFKKKLSSILQHKSQDPQKFAYATKLLNRFRSAQCNAPDGHYAEAFRADKRFPYTEIRSLLPPAPPLRKFYKSLSDSMI